MATKKTTKKATSKRTPARGAAKARPAAKPAAKRAVRRPGPAESALAGVGRRADAASETVGTLARRGGEAAASGLDSARKGVGATIDRARRTWDGLDPKGKAGVAAGALAALAAVVAVPLARKNGKKKK